MIMSKIRFTYVIPSLYLILAAAFAISVLDSTGHEVNHFRFVLDLSKPGCLAVDLLHPVLKSWQPLLSVALCLLAGVSQYLLIGYVIHRIIRQVRARRQ